MNATSFAKAQTLCRDVKAARRQVEVFHKLARKALDDQRYEDAAVCFENAAIFARKTHEAGR